ncbi:outer membrane beta-barrel protein [Bacteroidota bacterium]
MKGILIILLAFSSISVFGQNHYIGILAGINESHSLLSTSISESGSITCFSSGITYDYRIKKHINLGANILYFQNRFSTPSQIFPNKYGTNIWSNEYIDFKFNYISFQFKGGYIVGKNFFANLNLGIIPSILLKAQNTYSYFDKKETVDVTTKFPRFDYSGLCEIGCGYSFKNNFVLFSSLTYLQSFLKSKAEYGILQKVTTLSLGLKYGLKI